MYKIGQTFDKKYPPEAAIWCNENNCHIETFEKGYIIVKTAEYIPTNEDKIAELKNQLSAMDYKTSKRADGEYTDAEWADIVAERQAIRAQIKELENA